MLFTFRVYYFFERAFEQGIDDIVFFFEAIDVFPCLSFFFFIFYTVKYGFLDGTFFGTMTDFETTFDVKGHLEWGLRYRRCDRVSGCWL